jgi:hypothetical protein
MDEWQKMGETGCNIEWKQVYFYYTNQIVNQSKGLTSIIV